MDPSSLIERGMTRKLDPVVAFLLNDVLFHRLIAAEAEANRRGGNKFDGAIPPGTVYETTADIVH